MQMRPWVSCATSMSWGRLVRKGAAEVLCCAVVFTAYQEHRIIPG